MNSNNQKHNENGPAVISENENYMEWWKNGSLIAYYDNGKLKKFLNSEQSIELEVKEKWKGMESFLSLDDLNTLNAKPIHSKVKESEDKIEFLNEKNEFSRVDGPAVICKNENYMEWWKNGALIACYDNEKLFKYNSIDSKSEIDMEAMNKFRGKEKNISLEDIVKAPLKEEKELNQNLQNTQNSGKGVLSDGVRQAMRESNNLLEEQSRLIKLRESNINNKSSKDLIEEMPQQKETIKRIAQIRESLNSQSNNQNKLKF